MVYKVGYGIFQGTPDTPARAYPLLPAPDVGIIVAQCPAVNIGGEYAPVSRVRNGVGILGYALGTATDSSTIDTLFVYHGDPVTGIMTEITEQIYSTDILLSSRSVSMIANGFSILTAYEDVDVNDESIVKLHLGLIGDEETIPYYEYLDAGVSGSMITIGSDVMDIVLKGSSPKLTIGNKYGKPYMFYSRDTGEGIDIMKYQLPLSQAGGPIGGPPIGPP